MSLDIDMSTEKIARFRAVVSNGRGLDTRSRLQPRKRHYDTLPSTEGLRLLRICVNNRDS